MAEPLKPRQPASEIFNKLQTLTRARTLSGQIAGDGNTLALMTMGNLARNLVDAVRAESKPGEPIGSPFADQYRDLSERDPATADELYKLVVEVNGVRPGVDKKASEAQVREIFGLPLLPTEEQ